VGEKFVGAVDPALDCALSLLDRMADAKLFSVAAAEDLMPPLIQVQTLCVGLAVIPRTDGCDWGCCVGLQAFKGKGKAKAVDFMLMLVEIGAVDQ
jgi:hypothetical protein